MIPITFGIVAAIAVVVWYIAREWRYAEETRKRFPPISDEEFLALCKPGTNPRIALGVRRIVSEQLGVDYDRIHPDTRFVEDLGCD